MKIAILQAEITTEYVINKANSIEENYRNFFKSLPFQLKFFNLQQGQWPDTYDGFSAFIITGSKYDVDMPLPWIERLKKFVVEFKGPKLIGICFGHQLIAHALGGQVGPSSSEWNLGLNKIMIMKKTHWMNPYQEELHLIFNNRCEVQRLPANSELLATSTSNAHQMYQIGSTILAMQFHPEFSKEYQCALMDCNHDMLGKNAIISAKASYDKAHCSTEIVRKWISNFLTA